MLAIKLTKEKRQELYSQNSKFPSPSFSPQNVITHNNGNHTMEERFRTFRKKMKKITEFFTVAHMSTLRHG